MPISEAQKKASKKYLSGLEEIKIRAPKGTKEKLRTSADRNGKSVNAFILDLIKKAIS